ncbi:tape measure protein [Yersinia frederiksenii]|uniref:tape measure protein n=1 Tax=Yersinia frederiksenii TaxID=29484 RepID=UPI0005E90BA2|nr:tape measure protein [Yersinia frederiksenii]CFR14987.1 Phage-related minor tail protein [Yersinia frederiksenii]
MASEQQLGNIVYQVEMEVGKLIAAQNKVNERLDQMQGKFEKTASSTGKLETGLNKVGAAIAAYFTLEAAKKVIGIADAFTVLQARIARLSPDIDTAKQTFSELINIAQTTGASVADTARLWESLTASLKDMGATNPQILQLTETLQKIGTIGGSSATEMSLALRQFGQSISAGIVRAEEFNSIVENMPELARQIAKGMGIPFNELRQQMLAGKITAEDALQAIQAQASTVSAEFDKMPVSVERAANAFETELSRAIYQLDKTIGFTQALSKVIQQTTKDIQNLMGNTSQQDKFNAYFEERVNLQETLQIGIKKGKLSLREQEGIQKRINALGQEMKSIQDKVKNDTIAKNKEIELNRTTKISEANQKVTDELDKQIKLQGMSDREAFAYKVTSKLDKGTDPKELASTEAKALALYDQQQAQKDANKALQESESAAKSAASADAQRNKQLAEQINGLRVLELQYKGLNKEAARLEAVNALGSDASQSQIDQAIANSDAKFQIEQRYADKKEALEFNLEEKIRQIRDSGIAQLERQLAAGDISFEQSQQRRLQIVANYSKAIAEASAASSVSPQQQNAALVDPVQALANENAQKLALIQKFEEDKTLTEQQALTLRNAANTQYEQARLAAQWDIWRNQSEGNQYLASSLESLGQRSTNILTGLIMQTQSGKQAMLNLASTIAQDGIGALVDMGLQYVKNMIMGQAAATTALAATAAQATAAAAAWAPAAVSASIATMGGASSVGTTAYGTALAASKGLALAGARKNGGPVSAGSMYRVGEGGAPEIYQAGTGKQYMIPGDNGKVISNKDMQGGSGGGGTVVQQEFHFNIQTTNGIDDATMQRMAAMMKTVSLNTIKDQQRPNGLLRK